MNIYKISIPVFIIVAMASCSPSMNSANEKAVNDNTLTADKDTSLVAKMDLPTSEKLGSPITMTFTVYNHTDAIRTFCKWHTPFEPPLSKYLDITSTTATEPTYVGAMAKRIMPPPADSYLSINPGDSLNITVDISKSYKFNAPGKYFIHYNAENISELKVQDATLVLTKP